MENSGFSDDISGVEKAVEADEDGSHLFSNNWDVLFGGDNFSGKIKKLGIQGHLRGCCFRSVCWKVFLGVLPEERSKWVQSMKDHRKAFAKIRKEFLDDPRGKGAASDAAFNNPLSLDEESPWNQFFQDEELKKMVTQDVDRTYPDMDFFQMDRIKTIMSNVLFCFARSHKNLGYRQGIHELLAPIIFVLDSDKRNKDTVPADEDYTDEMLVVLDSESLEADAYVLLDALMETCGEWYEHGPADVGLSGKKSPASLDDTKLFQGEEDANPSSAVVRKLERIQQVLIKKEDPELHSHLAKLAIPPQIFGLRWIRLLFAREFELMDILLLWDAIFAQSQYLDLVDSVALAMLLFIRGPLIAGTYVNVLQLLLNFPVVADVQYIIQRALFLQDPNLYPRPPNWQLQSTDSSSSATLSAPAGLRSSSRLTAVRSGVTQSARSLAGKTASLFKRPDGTTAPRSTFYSDDITSVPSTLSEASRPTPSASVQRRLTQHQQQAADDVASSASPLLAENSTFFTTPVPAAEPATGQEKALGPITKPPAEQLSQWLEICKLCGDQMQTCLRALETQLVAVELPEGVDDKVFLSIAGMKQVRDLMRGTLGYDISREEASSILSIDVTNRISEGSSSSIPDPASQGGGASDESEDKSATVDSAGS